VIHLPTPPDSARMIKGPTEPRSSSPAPCTPTQYSSQARVPSTSLFALPRTPKSIRRNHSVTPFTDIINSSHTPEIKKSLMSPGPDLIEESLPNEDDGFFCIPSSQNSISRHEIIPSSQTQTIIPESPFTPPNYRTKSPPLMYKVKAKSAKSNLPRLSGLVWHFNVPSTQEHISNTPSPEPNTIIGMNKQRVLSSSPGPAYLKSTFTKNVSAPFPSSHLTERLHSAAFPWDFNQVIVAATPRRINGKGFKKAKDLIDSTVTSLSDAKHRNNGGSERKINDCSVIPETPLR
jgi:hypothetical protein